MKKKISSSCHGGSADQQRRHRGGMRRLVTNMGQLVSKKFWWLVGYPSSVVDYGCAEEPNPEARKSMEDAVTAIDTFGGNINEGFFAVYDDHAKSATVCVH